MEGGVWLVGFVFKYSFTLQVVKMDEKEGALELFNLQHKAKTYLGKVADLKNTALGQRNYLCTFVLFCLTIGRF